MKKNIVLTHEDYDKVTNSLELLKLAVKVGIYSRSLLRTVLVFARMTEPFSSSLDEKVKTTIRLAEDSIENDELIDVCENYANKLFEESLNLPTLELDRVLCIVNTAWACCSGGGRQVGCIRYSIYHASMFLGNEVVLKVMKKELPWLSFEEAISDD